MVEGVGRCSLLLHALRALHIVGIPFIQSAEVLTVEHSAKSPTLSIDIPVLNDVSVLAGFMGVQAGLERRIVRIIVLAPYRQLFEFSCQLGLVEVGVLPCEFWIVIVGHP